MASIAGELFRSLQVRFGSYFISTYWIKFRFNGLQNVGILSDGDCRVVKMWEKL